MLTPLVLPVLADKGVTAVNTANNHGYDFGVKGLVMSAQQIVDADIEPLQHGEIVELQGLGIFPLSFKRG